jgi:parvulin-like peptidyl-prolyl isomerase
MPDQIRAAHILISHEAASGTGSQLSRDDAEKRVGELKGKLADGADFAELAREYSDCPSSQAGGDLGFFSRGDMVPEFDKAAFDLKVDEVSDVIETDFGFHLIQRTA